MRQDHFGFYLVDVLSAGAAASCGVHLYITVPYFHIYLFSFGHYSHGGCAGMHTATGFRIRYPLHAVHAALEFHGAIHIVAYDFYLHFLVAANGPFVLTEDGGF